MNETSDIITYLRIIPVVCLTFVRGLVPNSILERGQKAVKEEKRHRRRKKTDDCKEKRNWKKQIADSYKQRTTIHATAH
jgi:hypothetical protein